MLAILDVGYIEYFFRIFKYVILPFFPGWVRMLTQAVTGWNLETCAHQLKTWAVLVLNKIYKWEMKIYVSVNFVNVFLNVTE